MENIIDSIYSLCNNVRWYSKRKYDYSILIDEISDLGYKIKHVYPTKKRAIYEAYLFWEDMRWTISCYVTGKRFKEFKKLYRYEKLTYQYIDSVYGK